MRGQIGTLGQIALVVVTIIAVYVVLRYGFDIQMSIPDRISGAYT